MAAAWVRARATSCAETVHRLPVLVVRWCWGRFRREPFFGGDHVIGNL